MASPSGLHSGSRSGQTNCLARILHPESTIISKYGRAASRSANLLIPGTRGRVVRSYGIVPRHMTRCGEKHKPIMQENYNDVNISLL